MLIYRSQESVQIQEHGVSQWENGGRIVKTSEDQYHRSDSNSSRSSDAAENVSPKISPHNISSTNQHQTTKPDLNRVFIRWI